MRAASDLIERVFTRAFGEGFYKELQGFLGAFSGMFGGMRAHAEAVRKLLSSDEAAFVLVTSPEPAALAEAAFFQAKIKELGLPFAGLRPQPELGVHARFLGPESIELGRRRGRDGARRAEEARSARRRRAMACPARSRPPRAAAHGNRVGRGHRDASSRRRRRGPRRSRRSLHVTSYASRVPDRLRSARPLASRRHEGRRLLQAPARHPGPIRRFRDERLSAGAAPGDEGREADEARVARAQRGSFVVARDRHAHRIRRARQLASRSTRGRRCSSTRC